MRLLIYNELAAAEIKLVCHKNLSKFFVKRNQVVNENDRNTYLMLCLFMSL